jgi:hypothetical protein
MEMSMAEATEKAGPTATKAKQGRSPAYPGIPVGEAIGKAKALYDAQGKYAAPMPLAFTAWGSSAKSSAAREIRAALKYFGLITLEGDGETGKVKLTEDALRILLDDREDQTEKKAIIRRVALNPVVHKKLLEHFPEGIKSDASVEHFLVFEEGFNKTAAGAVVAEFKATADFAELYKPATIVVKSDLEPQTDDQSEENVGGAGESGKIPPKPLVPKGQVKIMDGERVAFTEEGQPGQYLKLIASGDVDDTMLEALEDFVKRQRKRLAAPKTPSEN